VTIGLDRRSFAIWDVAAHDWLVEAGAFELVVARSSVDVVAVRRHDVASSDQIAVVAEPAGFVANDAEFVALLGHPVPPVPEVRPFHRNSTLEDMEATWLGRRLAAVILSQALREAAHEFPDPDAATQAMIRSAVREGPARSLVLLSGGKVNFAGLDATLALLNGRPSDAVGVVSKALRPPR
jgi:beta-glucosidase